MKRTTYAQAGVDIDSKNNAVNKLIKQLSYKRSTNSSLNLKGHYAGIFDLGEFYGALTTDGVGTKLIIAQELNKWDTVGIDCIAMNVNDLIVLGVEPISMVDYIATDKINESILEDIGKGLNEGAKIANIEIVGGETALMPDMVNGIDLSGTAFGISKGKRIIDGNEISDGDLIIGLSSSGVHSNGYSLIRKIIKDNNISLDEKIDGKSLGDLLITPTKIYVRDILPIIDMVNGMAHITGGSFRNLVRLTKKHSFVLNNLIPPQKIFEFIKKEGSVEDTEMYQTFNMGMGFAIIANEKYEKEILNATHNHNPKVVGYIEKGEGVYIKEYNIKYEKY
ncbi:MAG: phosphoribosylformylglycinamidine cyclo-ligase [Thermoplasmata archaeon]